MHKRCRTHDEFATVKAFNSIRDPVAAIRHRAEENPVRPNLPGMIYGIRQSFPPPRYLTKQTELYFSCSKKFTWRANHNFPRSPATASPHSWIPVCTASFAVLARVRRPSFWPVYFILNGHNTRKNNILHRIAVVFWTVLNYGHLRHSFNLLYLICTS